MLAAFHVRAGVQLADRPLPEVSADDSCELAATFIPINRKHRPRDIAVVQKVGSKSPQGFRQIRPDDIACVEQCFDKTIWVARESAVESTLHGSLGSRIELGNICEILNGRRDQAARHQALMKDVDEDVEYRAGEWLRERMLVLPPTSELGHRPFVVGRPYLPMRRKFRKASKAICAVEVTARLRENIVDHGRKMHGRDQRHAVGEGLLEAKIFRGTRFPGAARPVR